MKISPGEKKNSTLIVATRVELAETSGLIETRMFVYSLFCKVMALSLETPSIPVTRNRTTNRSHKHFFAILSFIVVALDSLISTDNYAVH